MYQPSRRAKACLGLPIKWEDAVTMKFFFTHFNYLHIRIYMKKYISSIFLLLATSFTWAQGTIEEVGPVGGLIEKVYKTHTDSTNYPEDDPNFSWDIQVRENYDLDKPFRFTASDDKTFRARYNEFTVLPTEYTSNSDIPNVDEYAINTSAPVGSIDASYAVSPTGAAMYNVPIDVAPGTQGIQPSFGVSYSSQSGNGILGMGWHLNGVSAVTRTNATL